MTTAFLRAAMVFPKNLYISNAFSRCLSLSRKDHTVPPKGERKSCSKAAFPADGIGVVSGVPLGPSFDVASGGLFALIRLPPAVVQTIFDPTRSQEA